MADKGFSLAGNVVDMSMSCQCHQIILADAADRGDILLLVTGLVTRHLTQIMSCQLTWISPNQLQIVMMMVQVILMMKLILGQHECNVDTNTS